MSVDLVNKIQCLNVLFLQEKCVQYWPDKGESKTWGVFIAENIQEEQFADYVIREFSLKNQVGHETSYVYVSEHIVNVLRASDYFVLCNICTLYMIKRTTRESYLAK